MSDRFEYSGDWESALGLVGQAPAAGAPVQVRAGWLLAMAEALQEAGATDLYESTHDTVIEMVSDVITAVAVGAPESRVSRVSHDDVWAATAEPRDDAEVPF